MHCKLKSSCNHGDAETERLSGHALQAQKRTLADAERRSGSEKVRERRAQKDLIRKTGPSLNQGAAEVRNGLK